MSLEEQRRVLQGALDAERTRRARNALGQYATPPDLARQIARLALGCLRGPVRFLDPSIGSGSFFSALLAVRGPRRVEAAVGIEIDERFAKTARRLWGSEGLVLRHADFTRVAPPRSEGDRATLVLANPPYVRHHHLEGSAKQGLKQRSEAMLGRTVSGLSGLYLHFVLLAHAWMARGAVAAWLLPGEWMDVNYGAALREYLSTRVTLLRIHRFAAREAQFGDALVSSAVVLLRNDAPAPRAACEMTLGSLEEPARRARVAVRDLEGAAKWSRFLQDGSARAPTGGPRLTLGELFDVKRGIATGANRFFVRPRADFRAIGIPDRVLRPVLPSSRHLTGDVIERAPDGYPDVAVPLALLDCRAAETEVRRSCPRLWSYLDSPEGRRARTGYLTRGRSPWYVQERRAGAPIVVTYMGRGRRGGAPFRFFWNRSDATATNVYLLLCPRPHVAELLRADPERARCVLEFLQRTDLAELVAQGRVYGGGLHKLEPRELARLDATRLAGQLGLDPRHIPTDRLPAAGPT